MPRFVILQHDHPFLHWDLMLETGSVLQTWRLASPPSADAAVRAEPLGAHRLLYLDYEGPVSGGRGSVSLWDKGTYEDYRAHGDAAAFRLLGTKVQGRYLMQRQADGWKLLAHPGEAE